ncbi:MAG: heme peroxidase [Gordonia sp.]|nr:heme peroxidase [Gordonia sp. (in: high G+C Gram-positive bacteria)]
MSNLVGLYTLVDTCEQELGDPDLWFKPSGYPESLALCIVDSIYSTGAHYTQVVRIVDRYCKHRQAAGHDAYADSARDLLSSIDGAGGVEQWAAEVAQNNRPTSTKAGAPLKAFAIAEAARGLESLGVLTAEDLRTRAGSGNLDDVKRMWIAIPGQRSGITWEYALMLAGIPGVKGDRMVTRYVARVLDVSTAEVGPELAAVYVKAVAAEKKWNVIHTDHAIWRLESGREIATS